MLDAEIGSRFPDLRGDAGQRRHVLVPEGLLEGLPGLSWGEAVRSWMQRLNVQITQCGEPQGDVDRC